MPVHSGSRLGKRRHGLSSRSLLAPLLPTTPKPAHDRAHGRAQDADPGRHDRTQPR